MCGLVGVAGALVARDESLMKKLLLWDWLRGPDATGLAAIRSNGDCVISKVDNHPLTLFEMSSFSRALRGLDSKVFLGHNRAATRGRNNTANAHPFVYGDIVGAHNGTLDYSAQSALEDALEEKFDVDSQALIAAISRLGIKDTIEMISGAWSIVYYNRKDNTLNMIRNKERPMWYAYSKEFNRLFWSSEWEYIRSAIKLTGGYEVYADKNNIGYFETEVDTLYSWDVSELTTAGGKFPRPKTKKIEGKKYTPVTYTNPNSSDAGSGGAHGFFPSARNSQNTGSRKQGRGTTKQSTGTSSTTHSSTSSVEPILNVLGRPDKPFGDWLNRTEFEERTSYGCSWCEQPVEFGVSGVVIYERDNTVLGPCCSGETRRNRVIAKNRIYG